MSHVYRRPHDYRVAAAASVAIFFAGLAGVSGSISQTLPSLSQSATASEEFTGTIAQTLPSLSQAAAGVSAQAVSGSIAQTLPSISQAVAGDSTVPGVSGSVAQALPSLTQAVAGDLTFTGSIAQTLPSLSQAATASEEFTGTIAQTLPSVSQQSTGQASQFAVFTGVEATFSIGTFIASSISWTDVTLPGADSYSSVDTTTSNTYTDVC